MPNPSELERQKVPTFCLWCGLDTSFIAHGPALCLGCGDVMQSAHPAELVRTIADVAGRLALSRADLTEAVALLRRYQWGDLMADECICCGNYQSQGHTKTCRLAALLAKHPEKGATTCVR